MKKTLVALAVLATSSAHAGFEIYNQDKVSVTMGGDIEVVYMQSKSDSFLSDNVTVDTKDTDFHQEIQDADLSFDVRYAINDSLQFGGFWEFTDVGQSEGDAYVALYSDTAGSFKVGRLCAVMDDAGIGSDYQFGLNTFFGGSDDHFCADETIRWDLDNGDFYAAAALVQDKNNSTDLDEDTVYFDAKLGYRVADFDFTGFYGSGEIEDNTAAGKHDETLWSLQARYSGVENLELAVAYYNVDDSADTIDTIGLAATYTIQKVTLAAGYSTSEQDGADDFDTWYVNAGYGIAPNTTLYAEVGGDNGEQANGDSTETGVAVGVKAYF